MNDFEKVADENDKEYLTYTSSQEFAFEFVRGSKVLTCTIPKGNNRFKKKLEKFLEEGVPGVELKVDGKDCQVWSFPVKFLRINKPKKKRELTEEERKILRDRINKARESKKSVDLSEDEEDILDEMLEDEE